jgi:hypothetical protein
MIVVHYVEVSTLYPHILFGVWHRDHYIRRRVENLLSAILYTLFGVWPRDHYMLLQRSTTVVFHALLQFLDKQSALAVPRFPAQSIPSCTMRFRQFTKYVRKTDHKVWCHLYSTEHDTQPIANLISKQVIPYRTCSSTCCPRGSTPSRFEHDKPHYLMESNCLHHFNLAQITVLILTTVKSHLTRTQAKLNITKDGKTCTTHMTAWLSRTNQV